MSAQSILGPVSIPAPLSRILFLHLVATEVQAPDDYAALASTFPNAATVTGSAKPANNRAYRMTAPKALAHPTVARSGASSSTTTARTPTCGSWSGWEYEELPEVSETMVKLAMTWLMLHRLARPSRWRLPAP